MTYLKYGEATPKYYVDVTYAEAPEYVKYRNVLKGYRVGGNYLRCLLSLFEWHVETLNAWTMIAASVISVMLLKRTFETLDLQIDQTVPFVALTASALLHLPFTVGFHLFRGIGPEEYNLWRRLDQIFILVASVLLTFAFGYFVFPWWGLASNCGIALAIAFCGSRDLWGLKPECQRPPARVVNFMSGIVLCYFFPMLYQSVLDLLYLDVGASFWAWLGVTISLAAGAFVFGAGIPEKWLPGTFDTIGFSHQLMHVAVLCAHIFEYMFLLANCKRHAVLIPKER